MDIAALKLDLGAQLLQPPQVQVNRPGADRAATRQRHLRLTPPGQKRPQNQDRGPHAPDKVIGCGGVVDVARCQRQGPSDMTVAFAAVALHRHRGPMLGQQIDHRGDVRQVRQVGQRQGLPRQQARGHQRQGCILRSANGNRPVERPAAADADHIHSVVSLGSDAWPKGRNNRQQIKDAAG